MTDELHSIEVLNRTANRVTHLSEAGRILSSSIDLKTTFRHLAKVIVPAIADSCGILLFKPDGNVERVILAHIDPEKEKRLREFDAQFPVQKDAPWSLFAVATNRKSVLVHDTTNDSFYPEAPMLREFIRATEAKSYMLLPLVVGETEVVGGIGLVTSEDPVRRYTEEDLEFAQDLAALAARAVHNATLHSQAIGEAEKLKVLRKIREEFILDQVHDIKTPLTAVSLSLQMIARKCGPEVSPQIRRAIENVQKAVEMINNLSRKSPKTDDLAA